MKISFPFAILKMLAIELPQLEFRLSQLQIANQDLKINNQLLRRRQPHAQQSSTDLPFESTQANSSNDDLSYEFIGPHLTHELKQQHQANKQAAFFNFELLKYEFKYATTSSQPPPLVLNAAWSCANPSDHMFELTLDYSFNFRKNLSQANFMVILPLTVVWSDQMCKISLVKSELSQNTTPMTQENENKLQVLWQIGSINSSSRITARFQLTAPGGEKPSSTSTITSTSYEQFYQPVYAKFHIDNETLSQVKLQLLSPNYKLSLLREKVETGKYFCNYDPQQQQQQHVISSPSSSTSTIKPAVVTTPTSSQVLESQKVVQQNGCDGSSGATTPTSSIANTSPPLTTSQSSSNLSTTGTAKKTPAAGSLSTHIGSTVDVLLNY